MRRPSALLAATVLTCLWSLCPQDAQAQTWWWLDRSYMLTNQNLPGTRLTGPNVQPDAQDKTTGATLISYGPAFGDSRYYGNDDGFLGPIPLPATVAGTKWNIPVFSQSYSGVFVNMNGSLSFGGGISAFESTPLSAYRGVPMLAPFWADVDTRGGGAGGPPGNNRIGNSIYYRFSSGAELGTLGSRIATAAGVAHFNPVHATVVTWDRVAAYPDYTSSLVNTFQMVVATDGLRTYTLYLYPNQAIWWTTGTASHGAFASVGVTDGTGNLVQEAASSGSVGVRDIWFQSNTANNAPGEYIFQVADNTATALVIAGDHNLFPNASAVSTAVGTVTLGANPAGHVITSSNVAGGLLFNALRFENTADSVTFTDKAVVFANAADAITHGQLTFTDTALLNARAPGSLNGGTVTLAKSATLALYAADATTAATTLRFDNTAGAAGGTFDLRGFSTTLGGIASVNATGGVVTNSGTATPATLTSSFNDATFTFGGTLQNGTSTLALAKAGTGTLVLTGTNTFTGGTTLTGGTLELGSTGALGTTGAIAFTGGTLRFSSANTTDYSARFSTAAGQAYRVDTNSQEVTFATALASSGGSLTKLGAGTLTLAAPSTYSGSTYVRGGTLRAGAANVFSANSAYFLLGHATLDLAGRDQTVGDLDSYHAATGLLEASTVNLGGATLTNLNRVANLWAGTLTGNGTFVKKGAATMSWYAPNTFTGTLQIDAGIVSTQALNTLSPNATVAIADGASLHLNGGAQTIAGLTGSGTVQLASGRLTIQSASDQTLTTAIHGTGGLTKSGTGTLSIAESAPVYTGETRVAAGTARFLGALPSGNFTVDAGARLEFSATSFNLSRLSGFGTVATNAALTSTATQTLGVALTGTASLQHSGTGTLSLSAASNYSGGTVVRGATLATDATNTLSANSAYFITNGATLALRGHAQTVGDLDSYDSVTGNYYSAGTVNLGGATLTNLNRVTNNWGGALTGTGTFIKKGTAAMNWAGQNTFTGPLQIDAGTITAQAAHTLSPNASVAIASGATLHLNGHAQTIAGLSGGGTVALASGILTTNQASNSTFAGVITGTGSVGKGGSGTLTLSTANNHSGGITLNLGTLVAGHIAAFGTGAVRINAGTLNLANLAVNNALDVRGGSITGLANYTGTQTVSALMTYSGNVSGTIVVANGGTLNTTGATFTGTTTVQVGGAIRGTGTLGALTLNSGATLTPGNSPGTLTVTGNATWHGGANYVWEINDAFSPATSAGTNYDLVSISGALTLAATPENKITLSLVSLLANNSAGDVLNFNAAIDSAYTIATTTGGIFGFDASAFTINATGFTNALNGGAWSLALANSNRDLQLNFTAAAIPEPSTYAIIFGALVLGWAVYRKRPARC